MLLAVLLALAVVLVFLGWRRQPGPFAVEWTASGARSCAIGARGGPA